MSNFKELKEEFYKVTKRVIKTNLTQNQHKREEYKLDLVEKYNNLIEYTRNKHTTLSPVLQRKISLSINTLRDRLQECFIRLGVNIELEEDIFSFVSLSTASEFVLETNVQEEENKTEKR